MRVLVIRHSIRENNQEDCSISHEGVKLINSKTDEIREHLNYPYIIYTSPYKRTIQTAMCIANNFDCDCNIIIDKKLHETLFDKNNMLNQETQIVSSFVNKTQESWSDVKKRCEELLIQCVNVLIELKTCETGSDNIILVTHGGVVNMLLQLVCPEYTFDKNEKNPDKYIPKYCDYDVDMKKWIFVFKSF